MSKEVLNKIDFLKFKGTWRNYQSRVLNELENYLDDKKLNVVAAPGAGKTTLGIEVLSRLGKPALIIAPTITIRNQWKKRICESFIDDEYYENFISTTAEDIRPITILTYQLLHSVFKYQETLDNFISKLRDNQIRTIVLDEAHHLRTEWFLSIKNLCEILEEDNSLKIISLTGTPPYDVPVKEWLNYKSLCGPVDAEISIPELVKQGDLCPHQDLIHFSELSEDDKKYTSEFNDNRNQFMKFLSSDAKFYSAIRTSNLLDNLEENSSILYEDTNFTVAIVSYLFSRDEMDMTALLLLNFLCLEKWNIPSWSYESAEILINGLLNDFKPYIKIPADVIEKLKEFKLFETSKKVNLSNIQNVKKLFMRSKNKIKSIKDITHLEFENLKENLREVVLLDYIGSENLQGLNILSVFDELKNNEFKICILSGSLVVIPVSAKDTLSSICDDSLISFSDYCENYLKVDFSGKVNMVELVTELFNKGEFNVIVGTQALLGEGWDSPCVNTLIIASAIGSFMLSNQMRGRAIRLDKNYRDKTSNIWHLVTIDDVENFDWETINNRFNTFEGISFIDNTIQSGINRLGINNDYLNSSQFEKLNQMFEKRALERDLMKKKWTQIFQNSVIKEENFVSQVYGVVETQKVQLPVLLIKHEENWCVKNYLIPWFAKFKTKKVQQNTNVLLVGLLETLYKLDLIKTPSYKIQIKNFISSSYIPYTTIVNCTNYERELFLSVISELYSKPNTQRYILKHEDKYLTVPEVIGVNKKNVKLFAEKIEPYFGYLDVIFTKSPNGRKELLKAQYNQLVDETLKTGRIWI